MSSPITLTGGTGTLGTQVAPLLRAAGHQLRVLSRRPRPDEAGTCYVVGDLLTGDGIAGAVDGVPTVVHLAGGPRGDDRAAQTLVRAAEAAGVEHIVLISVIGAGTVPLGYFRAKWEAERAITHSDVGCSILRAAQFHDLVLQVVRIMSRLPCLPVPRGLRFQPVDARDVAARLAELSAGGPVGRVADLAGPGVYGLDELAGSYLAARGAWRRPRVPVPFPGPAGRAYRAGANLNLRTATRGRRTWEAFLEERAVAAPRRATRPTRSPV